MRKLLISHQLYAMVSTLQPEGLPSLLVSKYPASDILLILLLKWHTLLTHFFPNTLQRFLTTLQTSITLHSRSPIDLFTCTASSLLYRYSTSHLVYDKQQSGCMTCILWIYLFLKNNIVSFHHVRALSLYADLKRIYSNYKELRSHII